MYDNGKVEYIRHEPFASGSAWRRELSKTPKEVEGIKRQIEVILARLKDNPGALKTSGRTLDSGIIVRTAEELVRAWGDDKYGDPRPQVRQVFKNWRDLDDETHERIQKVFQRCNDAAEALEWKWG